MSDRIRAMLDIRAEQLAAAIDETESAQGSYAGPRRELHDFPAHYQATMYEMAARELAHEWGKP